MTVTIVRCLLAACFGLAGIGKLSSGPERFGKTLERYDLPFGLVGKSVALQIIAVELCAAVLLLSPLYPAGAALAALLAAGFGFAVSGVLARGERFACQCFGAAINIMASTWLFAVDLLLLASALFLLRQYFRGNHSSPGELFILVMSTLVVGLGGQAARIGMRRRTMMGPPTGKSAPQFSAKTLGGRSIDSSEFYAGKGVMVFVTPGCPACVTLLSSIARTWNGGARLLVVGTGDEAGMRRLLERSEIPAATVLDGAGAPRVRQLFRMRASPAALILTHGRVVHKLIPANVEDISRLING